VKCLPLIAPNLGVLSVAEGVAPMQAPDQHEQQLPCKNGGEGAETQREEIRKNPFQLS